MRTATITRPKAATNVRGEIHGREKEKKCGMAMKSATTKMGIIDRPVL